MEKTLFKEYEQWCVAENKDPLKEETVAEFKIYKQQQENEKIENSQKEKRVQCEQEQEEIFQLICKYAGVKAKYNADYMFRTLDGIFKSIALASVMTNKEEEVSKTLEKVLG